jgi:four helix bundle protein
MALMPPGWRSHEEIVAWQLSTELKNRVYALIEADPRIQRDVRFRDHLEGAVSSAPRLIAEGFGRYLPGDFSGYLRKTNGELKEALECLADGVERGYFTPEQIVPLQRLCKRASKAATGLIAYLKTADPPNEEPRRRRTRGRRNPKNPNERRNLREPKNLKEPKEPREPIEQKPLEPIEPFEPMEPID